MCVTVVVDVVGVVDQDQDQDQLVDLSIAFCSSLVAYFIAFNISAAEAYSRRVQEVSELCKGFL